MKKLIGTMLIVGLMLGSTVSAGHWDLSDDFEGVPGVAPGSTDDADPANPPWSFMAESAPEMKLCPIPRMISAMRNPQKVNEKLYPAMPSVPKTAPMMSVFFLPITSAKYPEGISRTRIDTEYTA